MHYFPIKIEIYKIQNWILIWIKISGYEAHKITWGRFCIISKNTYLGRIRKYLPLKFIEL